MCGQVVGVAVGTNCAPLVADLFLYCCDGYFIDSLNHDNQADVIEAFNSTSKCLDDLWTLTVLVLAAWSVGFVHQNYS